MKHKLYKDMSASYWLWTFYNNGMIVHPVVAQQSVCSIVILPHKPQFITKKLWWWIYSMMAWQIERSSKGTFSQRQESRCCSKMCNKQDPIQAHVFPSQRHMSRFNICLCFYSFANCKAFQRESWGRCLINYVQRKKTKLCTILFFLEESEWSQVQCFVISYKCVKKNDLVGSVQVFRQWLNDGMLLLVPKWILSALHQDSEQVVIKNGSWIRCTHRGFHKCGAVKRAHRETVMCQSTSYLRALRHACFLSTVLSVLSLILLLIGG